MTQIRSKVNGGVVEADAALAKTLLAGGSWEEVKAPKPAKKAKESESEEAPEE